MTLHFTFDLDWAPAWATRALIEDVKRAEVPATFFVTHDCPCLAELRHDTRFELGWHPNYLPNSSHGSTPQTVVGYMRRLVPEAVGVRAHGLVRSTWLWQRYVNEGLAYEASDILDMQSHLQPLRAWHGLVRLPLYFSDDVHIRHGRPLRVEDLGLEQPGMKIFNFHPVLHALNICSFAPYEAMKVQLAQTGTALSEASEGDFEPFRNRDERGVGDLLRDLLAHVVQNPDLRGDRLSEVARNAPEP